MPLRLLSFSVQLELNLLTVRIAIGKVAGEMDGGSFSFVVRSITPSIHIFLVMHLPRTWTLQSPSQPPRIPPA